MSIYRYVVSLDFAAGSQHGTNTWHFRTDGVSVDREANLNALISIVSTFYSHVTAFVPTSYVITGPAEATEVGVADPEAVGGLTGFTRTGTGGTSYGGAPAMAVVTWRSSKASRRGRGRTFLGPMGPGMVQSDGTLDPAVRTSLLSAASELCSSSLADGNGAIGVYSQLDNLLRDVVSGTVTDQVAVLRSRRG